MYRVLNKDYDAIKHALSLIYNKGTCFMPYRDGLIEKEGPPALNTSCSICFYGKFCEKDEVLEAAKEYIIKHGSPEDLLCL